MASSPVDTPIPEAGSTFRPCESPDDALNAKQTKHDPAVASAWLSGRQANRLDRDPFRLER
jgi:hypothetical protein